MLSAAAIVAILILPAAAASAAQVRGAVGLPKSDGFGPSGAPSQLARASPFVARPSVNPIPQSVSETVDLVNNSVVAGNALPTNLVGLEAAPAAVPGTSDVLGSAQAGNLGPNGEIYLYDVANGSLLGQTASVVPLPYGAIYAPSDSSFWVACYGSAAAPGHAVTSAVDVVTALPTPSVTQTYLAGNGSYAVAYDPDGGLVAVTNLESDNVWLYNTTSLTATITAVGHAPTGIAYDAATNEIVVVNELSDNLSVLDGKTGALVRSINVSGTPSAVAIGPTGLAYVARYNDSDVQIVDVANGTREGTLPAAANTTSLLFDPATSILYATGPGPGQDITTWNLSSNASAGPIAVGHGLHDLGLAPSAGAIVVANEGLGTVAAFSETTRAALTDARLGSYPEALTFDETDARFFFADAATGALGSLSNNATLLNNSQQLYAQPGTSSAAWDAKNDLVWYAGFDLPLITVQYGATQSLRSNFNLFYLVSALAYDGRDNRMWASNYTTNTVLPSDASSYTSDAEVHTISNPISLLYDPGNGFLYVGSFAVVNGIAAQVGVVNASTEHQVHSVWVGGGAESLALDAANQFLYSFNYLTENVSVISTVDQQLVRTIALPLGSPSAMPSAAYDPTTGLIYVAMQQLNQVWLLNTTSGTIVSKIDVGVEPTTVVDDDKDGYVAVTNAGSGTISIIRDPGRQALTFVAENLPAGTSWNVTMLGVTHLVTTGSTTFWVQNGSFNYTVQPGTNWAVRGPANGSVVVDGLGASVEVTFRYNGPHYPVQFNEVGLPVQTPWSVTVLNVTLNSTSTQMLFTFQNGSYNWSVLGVAGYLASPTNGSFVVDENRTNITITFTQATFLVTFHESGLPAGTSWGASLGIDYVNHSAATEVSVAVPNGTYRYTILVPAGYNATPEVGTVVVVGGPIPVTVLFSPVAGPGQGASTAGPPVNGALVGFGLLGLAVLLIVVGFVLFGRERRAARALAPAEAPPSATPPSPEDPGPADDGTPPPTA